MTKAKKQREYEKWLVALKAQVSEWERAQTQHESELNAMMDARCPRSEGWRGTGGVRVRAKILQSQFVGAYI